ncbi:flagellin [Anaerobiospirillum sp. NML120449]|uniref:flagellin N-terminal helical domain-containing protein n=1 Tax=Anaerobiospirillum sp. NML120449 TaxID=2932817 RepID=UPI001FF3DD4D|nr:flagellin [Anaerobiospirillum sp. NML120449]MCK0526018.1 flagellin [Anaerobiospirillum sp. NML120449]
MAVYVNTNVSSLNGQRYLNNVQSQLNTTYNRLSSGLRINSAKDDAAGLQISSRLTTQINGLNQGNRNASDGIALVQTIEGSLDEMTNMLQKVRTLAVQAANGTNTAEDRTALKVEASNTITEYQRFVALTKFGGKLILNGNQPGNIYGNAQGGADGKLTLQVGANKGDTIDITVKNFALSVVAQNHADFLKINAGKTAGVTWVLLDDHESSSKVISGIDGILNVVNAARADLGAVMNRLESSIRNQSNVAANQSDARSRIRDADFAEESANLSQQSIIQQAATSMLMQANTRPQLGLSLLS